MYPIRRSRQLWAKNFSRPHQCSDLCFTQYEIQNNVIRITYQSGCLYPEKVEPAYIHLSDRNVDNQVKYTDEVVPVPRQILLLIEHPLRHPRMYEHVFEPDQVVYLSTLVELFDAHYRRMYAEEEEKATPREYWINEPCTQCNDDFYQESKLDDFVDAYTPEPDAAATSTCSICFEPGTLVRIRNCQHVYHRECLLRWFNTVRTDTESETEHKSNSCPMCRQPLLLCTPCQSTRTRKTRFFGAVPPFQANNEEQEDRPETDGPYGIRGIYYEELFFKGIYFDARQQVVRLLPLERVE